MNPPLLRVVGQHGTDLAVVNAARASFAKESNCLSAADSRLIRFLARHGHTSPFRHAALLLELETTKQQRDLLEGQANRAGLEFWPRLAQLAGYHPNEPVRYFLLGSLQALVRTYQTYAEEERLAELLPALRSALEDSFPVSTAAFLEPDREVAAAGSQQYYRPIPRQRLPVEDRGYVRLCDVLLGPVPELSLVTFEIKAPMLVRSQWFKYTRGCDQDPPGFIPHPLEECGTGNGDDAADGDPLYARNEMSRRYVTAAPEFYLPPVFYAPPADRKQGSGDPLAAADQQSLRDELAQLQRESAARYAVLCAQLAPEQARGWLYNYFLYSTWRLTSSFQAVQYFLDQRLDDRAQRALQAYARAVDALVAPYRSQLN